MPNKDTSEFPEKNAERKKTKAMPNPDTKSQDLGKIIWPSNNLAIAQKIIQKTRPNAKSNPFEISIGILVNGKQKIGNNTMTKNNDKKESLSNIFERINSIILH